MPRKKGPALKQPGRFSDADTLAIGVSWFAIIHRQAELKPWLDICEDMAFNLGEECIAIDSIRGANASTLETVSKTAFSGIDAKGQLLRQVTLIDAMGLAKLWSTTVFRQFVADSVARYKNPNGEPGDAEKGITHFAADPDRRKELVKVMEETWALVKDIDDAKKLYRKNDPAGGKEYNSEFRKCLSRKFNEADHKTKKRKAEREAARNDAEGENADPNTAGPADREAE
ncbi:g5378 [Coccomyxa elongata]